MIRDYADHAANERTFLAWLRTGKKRPLVGGRASRESRIIVSGRAVGAPPR